jgi:acetate kinase
MMYPILVVNAGSSSVKFSLYEYQGAAGLRLQLKGRMTGIGTSPRLSATDERGISLVDLGYTPAAIPDVPAAMAAAGAWLRDQVDVPPAAVGHRVVHGGPYFEAPRVVDDIVLFTLQRLVPLAPLHQPHNLAAIRAVRERFPNAVQVACFDTAFHRTHSEVADRYALPASLYRDGVRRYGFHGLSYEYIVRALPRVAPEIADGAVVVGHLGSGASLCAIQNGRSVDSTMGFTALDGLPMGTRCGRLDPGVVLYLLTAKGYDVSEVERLLYQRAGLRGLSGLSADVRDLLASRSAQARLALDYFVYHVGREIAALAATMGGLDALVLTGGIGENSPVMRERICASAAWLGITLDAAANENGGPCISTPGSAVSAWVVPTDEERMIAEHTVEAWQAHNTFTEMPALLHSRATKVR